MFLLEHPFFLCAIPMLFYANNINYYFILFILYLILFLFLFLFFSYIRDAKKNPLTMPFLRLQNATLWDADTITTRQPHDNYTTTTR